MGLLDKRYHQDNSQWKLPISQPRDKYIEQMIAHIGFPKDTKKRKRLEDPHHIIPYLHVLPVFNRKNVFNVCILHPPLTYLSEKLGVNEAALLRETNG